MAPMAIPGWTAASYLHTPPMFHPAASQLPTPFILALGKRKAEEMMCKPSATINVPPVSNYLEGEPRQRARRELLGMLGRDEAWLASAAADRSWIQVLNPVKTPSALECVPSDSALPRRLLSDADDVSSSTEVSSPAASPTPSAASSQHSNNPGVSIFPRCKAAFVGSSCKVLAARRGRGPIQIDLEAIKKYADQPQHLAASYLNVSLTALKSICRKLGFATWSEVRAASLPSTAAT